MIYVHNGTKEVERFGMPRCAFTIERQPWVRVYVAELPEHESHRGYPGLFEAVYAEPAAAGPIGRMLMEAIDYAVH